ncbi:MAG TPA: hypothetical protein VNA57_00955 [Acidimicrobiales bacterium]|nr:hypothetical protein [Acidimicrobiales bacterium]
MRRSGYRPLWLVGQETEVDLVLEADGDFEELTCVGLYDVADINVHNLTVSDIHTYYVVAHQPVLVHISSCPVPWTWAGTASASSTP